MTSKEKGDEGRAPKPPLNCSTPAVKSAALLSTVQPRMYTEPPFTNTPPLDAYRGAGKPEANYIIERLIDLAAKTIGVDSVELRRRNILSSFPHVTAMGMKIDGGRFASNLEEAVRAADRAGIHFRILNGSKGPANGRLRL